MKESEVLSLQNDLKSARSQIRNLHGEMKELADNQKVDTGGQMEEQHSQLKISLQRSQLDLEAKDKLLKDAMGRLEFSDSRLVKMEEFLNSQQLRIVSLEKTLQETEKVTLHPSLYVLI